MLFWVAGPKRFFWEGTVQGAEACLLIQLNRQGQEPGGKKKQIPRGNDRKKSKSNC